MVSPSRSDFLKEKTKEYRYRDKERSLAGTETLPPLGPETLLLAGPVTVSGPSLASIAGPCVPSSTQGLRGAGRG